MFNGHAVDKNKPAGLRHLAHVAAGLLIWSVTLVVVTRIVHRHPSSITVRLLAVAIGVGGFLPWLISVGRLIMAQDEFSVRAHLVAIAFTCAATAVLLMTGGYLQTAGLLGYVALRNIWMGMGILWWLSIVIASRYYR
jgi:hypothetical protein